MKAKVLAFCREEQLFQPGEKVICAVSGGADSVALLAVLQELRQELGITLEAAHFNHLLRGEESREDAAFVRSLCAQWGIPCHMGQGDVSAYAARTGQSIELAARLLRYEFFETLDCHKLATAHTAGDNTETVLSHLLRGSGLRGLSGIFPKRGKLVRPFLPLTREEITAYLTEKGLCFREDSSNQTDFCQRNRLRHRVVPLLLQEQPGLHTQLLERSKVLRQEDAFLDAMGEELLQRAERENGCDCTVLRQAHPVLCARALRLLLRRQYPQDLSQRHIESVCALVYSTAASARISLPMGLCAVKSYDLLSLQPEEQRPSCPTVVLKLHGETIIEDAGVKICCFFCENFQNFANTPFHFAVKYDMISQSRILVRARRQEDQIEIDGGRHKSLKKLFIEKKLPAHLRHRIPIFTIEETIFAAAGAVAPQYRALPGAAALIISTEI